MEGSFSSADLPMILGPMVPIFGVIGIVLVVLIVMHYRHKRAETLQETVRHLADKGQPIPAELFHAPGSADEPRSERATLMTVLSTVGAGLGLIVFSYISGLRILLGIGALVTIVGVAQLIAMWLTRKSSPPDDAGRAL